MTYAVARKRNGIIHISIQRPLNAGLAELISAHGPPEKLVLKDGSTFQALAQSIVSQQLATGAAKTIYLRFLIACKVAA